MSTKRAVKQSFNATSAAAQKQGLAAGQNVRQHGEAAGKVLRTKVKKAMQQGAKGAGTAQGYVAGFIKGLIG